MDCCVSGGVGQVCWWLCTHCVCRRSWAVLRLQGLIWLPSWSGSWRFLRSLTTVLRPWVADRFQTNVNGLFQTNVNGLEH